MRTTGITEIPNTTMSYQKHSNNNNRRSGARWSQQNVIDEEMSAAASYAAAGDDYNDTRSQVTPMQIVLQNRRDHGSYKNRKALKHDKTRESLDWKIASPGGEGFYRPSVELLPQSFIRDLQYKKEQHDDDRHHDHHRSNGYNNTTASSNGSDRSSSIESSSYHQPSTGAFTGSMMESINGDGDYADMGSVYNTPNFGDSSVALSQNWNENASTYTTATQYMSLRKMQHLYSETSSDMWLPVASTVKFKWGDKLCRLIHGTSTLGGSMIRVADWDTGHILETFEVNDIIGSKLITSADLKEDKARRSSFRRSGSGAQGRSSAPSSGTSSISNGHLYEEFPVANNTHAGSELHIYSYPRKRKQGIERAARVSRLQRLELAEDCHNAKECVRSINSLANPRIATSTTCARFLVILNSYYEKHRAKNVYDKYVKRMMNEADIEHDVFETIYPGHAHDRIREVLGKEQVDVIQYDGVVVIGRDGLMCEVRDRLSYY